MLHLGRLQALREVAARGTIAAAADGLHLTPSAVSQQLAALEREVGETLVEPDGRSVRLTPVARVLVRRADEIFAQVESLRSELAEHSGGERAELRVGSFSTGISRLVAPAAGRLHDSSPGIRVEVFEAEAPEAFAMLARHDLDLVLSMEAPGAPLPGDPRIARVELVADPLLAVLPAAHPKAGASSVALESLRGDPWVAPLEGWTCEHVILAACQTAGFTPRIAHRAGDWTAVGALVAAGLGVALVPRLAELSPLPGAVLVPLAGRPPCRHIFVACRRGAEEAPAMRVVIEALREAATASVPA